MAGVIKTERGLGDGIETLFQPLLDSFNDGVTVEEEKFVFPALAKNILNSVFSATVLSSFEEKSCSNRQFVSFDPTDGRFDIAGATTDELTISTAGLDQKTLTDFQKVMVNLDPSRRAAVLEAIGVKDLSDLELTEQIGDEAVLSEPEALCFAHENTSAFVSRGLQSGSVGFKAGLPAAEIGFNLSYASKVTIAGQEPKIERLQKPAAATTDSSPVLQGFTGVIEGKKELSTGGQCGGSRCVDEWVSGIAKITSIIGLRAKVIANVPKKLRDVAPTLGAEAGIQGVIVYTFPFLHYPRVKPTGIPGE